METNKRGAIIFAAFEELCINGLPDVSYDSIANRSGISRQLIRYYFPNQDELMRALYEFTGLAYRETLIELAANPDYTDRLAMIFDFCFDMLDEKRKPRDDQVYDAMLCLAARSEVLRESLRSGYSLLGNVVSHEVKIKFPQLTMNEAQQISYLFICLFYGHWKMVASLGFSEDHKFVTRRAMNRIIESYVKYPDSDGFSPILWNLD